ncbi:hypothetical protein NPS53_08100 [Pseudomonas putida]|uniref:hypothetical protein n=1 Tax=Pseudomonas putida TaxID=303 RepID=UPI002363F7F1|nr:hypothetical protein [Pseudomonas putida]MDD2139532.1 hypothetical protein [Pseudomonas putida]HDS1721455.1 hypothetical protein [Pseudomonas putida]
MTLDPDALAQFIRQIDGNNSMGAGALAEKICEWLRTTDVAKPLVSGWQLESMEAKVCDLDPDAESCVTNGDVLDLIKAVRTLQVRQHLL